MKPVAAVQAVSRRGQQSAPTHLYYHSERAPSMKQNEASFTLFRGWVCLRSPSKVHCNCCLISLGSLRCLHQTLSHCVEPRGQQLAHFTALDLFAPNICTPFEVLLGDSSVNMFELLKAHISMVMYSLWELCGSCDKSQLGCEFFRAQRQQGLCNVPYLKNKSQ